MGKSVIDAAAVGGKSSALAATGVEGAYCAPNAVARKDYVLQARHMMQDMTITRIIREGDHDWDPAPRANILGGTGQQISIQVYVDNNPRNLLIPRGIAQDLMYSIQEALGI